MSVHEKYKYCRKPENKNKKECREFILFYESIYVPTSQGEATFDQMFVPYRPLGPDDDTPTPVPKPKPEPPSGPRPDTDDKPQPEPDTKTDVKPDDKSPVVTPPDRTVVLNNPILIDTFDSSELYKTLLGEFSQKELENIIGDTERRMAGMVDPFVQNYFRQMQLLKRYGVSPETLSVVHPIIGLLPFNRFSGSVTPTPEPAPTAKDSMPTIRGATKKFKYLTPTRDDVEYTKAQNYNLKVLKNLKNEDLE